MARRFLYLVAALVILMVAALFTLNHWAENWSKLAFVPSVRFIAPRLRDTDAYDKAQFWMSRGAGSPGDPSRWQPSGLNNIGTTSPNRHLQAAVFFVHPTTLYDRSRWNAAPGDLLTDQRADLFARGLASPFADAAELWAPRYRQATIGAFLTDTPEGQKALNVAYGDVLAAFDNFLAHINPQRPIVLVGHSQGAMFVMRLLKDRAAGKPLSRRIAAAYIVGWPVSLAHDLPAMGLPACTTPDQSGCVLSWLSFAEPADPAMTLAAYARFPGLDGQNRAASTFLCTNPLTGRSFVPGADNAAPASANPGTLIADTNLFGAKLIPGMVPARCDADGLLRIGPPPEMGPFVLPGNNYHVYDIPMFWMSVRNDVARRVVAWHKSSNLGSSNQQGEP